MKKRTVALLLFDDVEVLDFAGPFEVFSVTNELNNYTLFDILTVAQSREPIRAKNGLVVQPDHAMADVLRAPLIGLDHTQRIKLALAIRFRYTHRRDGRWAHRYGHLIDDEDRIWSRRVGQALRLAHTLSGGVMDLLANYQLSLDGHGITLHCQPGTERLVGEAARKRLTAMARSFDQPARVLSD